MEERKSAHRILVKNLLDSYYTEGWQNNINMDLWADFSFIFIKP